MEIQEKHEYSESQLMLITEWKEKAQCFKYLLDKSDKYYNKRDQWIFWQLAIVTTTFGILQTSQDIFEMTTMRYIVYVSGVFNFLKLGLEMVKTYYKFGEMKTKAEINKVGYAKFVNRIKTQVAKDPEDRIPVKNFIDSLEQEYDRLYETNPSIHQAAIDNLNKHIVGIDIHKPDICGFRDLGIDKKETVSIKNFKNNYLMILDEEPSSNVIKRAITNGVLTLNSDSELKPLYDENI
jgi:hypothetical protein